MSPAGMQMSLVRQKTVSSRVIFAKFPDHIALQHRAA
jgi:hypothetical protein